MTPAKEWNNLYQILATWEQQHRKNPRAAPGVPGAPNMYQVVVRLGMAVKRATKEGWKGTPTGVHADFVRRPEDLRLVVTQTMRTALMTPAELLDLLSDMAASPNRVASRCLLPIGEPGTLWGLAWNRWGLLVQEMKEAVLRTEGPGAWNEVARAHAKELVEWVDKAIKRGLEEGWGDRYPKGLSKAWREDPEEWRRAWGLANAVADTPENAVEVWRMLASPKSRRLPKAEATLREMEDYGL